MTPVLKKRSEVRDKSKVMNFDIYECTVPSFFASKNIYVLAKDMQSALSTVKNTVSIKKLQGTILINKAVAKEIIENSKNKRKKED
jgi:uncharacterized protein YbcV (DUF1398 family)